MLELLKSSFDFLGNLGGLAALSALVIPKIADLYAARVSEKYKATLAKEVELFKNNLQLESAQALEVLRDQIRESAQRQERIRRNIARVATVINSSISELNSTRDVGNRLSIARDCYGKIAEYEELFRKRVLYDCLAKIDFIIEEDSRLYENQGDEWLSDLTESLYELYKQLTVLRETI